MTGRGLSETQRAEYLKLADALHELGTWQAEHLPPDFDTRTCWSTVGWKWGGELKQFIQDYDRSLQTANEVIGKLNAEMAELKQAQAPKAELRADGICGDPSGITCVLPAGHEGRHRNRSGSMEWQRTVVKIECPECHRDWTEWFNSLAPGHSAPHSIACACGHEFPVSPP